MSELPVVNPTGLLAHYSVDLLFQDDTGDLAAVSGDLEGLERCAGGEAGLVLRHRRPLERGAPPEWTLGEPTPIDRDTLAPLLAQSWWWRDAAAVAARCTHARRLSDHLFVTLDHRRRIRLFHRILAAAVEALPCRALAWWPSQQVIAPDDFIETMRAEGLESPAPGALNVRLFGLGGGGEENGEEGSFLMDTLGLGALGLLDLQCRFRGLDPHEVSHVLQATGIYLWQHGPVIRSGDSVQGLRPTDRWRCRAQRSAAEPERELLDLDPGFPFGLGA